jgi:hypothetical protein
METDLKDRCRNLNTIIIYIIKLPPLFPPLLLFLLSFTPVCIFPPPLLPYEFTYSVLARGGRGKKRCLLYGLLGWLLQCLHESL